MKIRHGFLITLLIICFVPLLLISSVLIYQSEIKTRDLFEESLSVAMQAQISTLEKFHHDQKTDMRIISRLPTAQNLLHKVEESKAIDTEYLSKLLRVRVEENDYLERIIIVDSDFNYLAASEELDETTSALANEIDDYNFVDNIAYTPVRYSPTYNCNIIGSVYRIMESDEVLGYIVRVYNLAFFKSLRTDLSLWENAAFYLLDGKHQIITAGTNDSEVEEFSTNDAERSDYMEKFWAVDRATHPKGSFEFTLNKD